MITITIPAYAMGIMAGLCWWGFAFWVARNEEVDGALPLYAQRRADEERVGNVFFFLGLGAFFIALALMDRFDVIPPTKLW